MRRKYYIYSYEIRTKIKKALRRAVITLKNSKKIKKLYKGKYYKILFHPSAAGIKKYRAILKPVSFIIIILFFFLGFKYIDSFFPGKPYKYSVKFEKCIINFCNEEKHSLFRAATNNLGCKLYQIQKNDNFWKIAKENNINIDTILGCNPYLNSIYASLGQEILIPDKIGVIHIIRKGESLRSLAGLYNVPVGKIEKYNKIPWWRFKKLKENDIIFIPNADPKVMTDEMSEFFHKRELFISPIAGTYTSGFGWRNHPIYRVRKFHKGLDIKARIGTAVCAVADGVVIFSGWLGGYGKAIKIQHAEAYMTGYGHLSRYYVKPGTKVKAGQIIGQSGNSGESTGPHLDFTIFKNNKPLNPALYLW